MLAWSPSGEGGQLTPGALITMAQHLATVTAERDRAREIAWDYWDNGIGYPLEHRGSPQCACRTCALQKEIASWP